MSIEAINWAMRQRLRGCAPQCLLFVLANAADPEGVAFGWWKSADHWWPYLIKHTRLARATIFNLLREMEEDGLLTRETRGAPEDGGHPQPVIRLHFDKIIEEAMPSERRAAAPAAESESIAWTQKTAEDPEKDAPSPANGLGLAGVEVHEVDSFESTSGTPKESYKENPDSPPNPPSRVASAAGPPKELGGREPIGFATFWTQYPDHETDNRKKAAAAFAALTERDREAAIERVGRYAEQIAKTARRPVSAWRWLQERRFTEYAPGALPGRPQRWFVPEAGEPWKAACALGMIATSGHELRIPKLWAVRGPDGVAGAYVPTTFMDNWQPWIVPLERWVFVEFGTAQAGRWLERLREILGYAPQPRTSPRFDASGTRNHRLFAADRQDWQPREYRGLLVPLEWPPAKTPKPETTGPPLAPLSKEDSSVVANF